MSSCSSSGNSATVLPCSFIMVIRQSEKFDPYIIMPAARSLLAIFLAPLQAASTFGKSSSCSGRVVVLSENSTLYFGMMNIQRSHGWHGRFVNSVAEPTLGRQINLFPCLIQIISRRNKHGYFL